MATDTSILLKVPEVTAENRKLVEFWRSKKNCFLLKRFLYPTWIIKSGAANTRRKLVKYSAVLTCPMREWQMTSFEKSLKVSNYFLRFTFTRHVTDQVESSLPFFLTWFKMLHTFAFFSNNKFCISMTFIETLVNVSFNYLLLHAEQIFLRLENRWTTPLSQKHSRYH